jgi:hypothetical protein
MTLSSEYEIRRRFFDFDTVVCGRGVTILIQISLLG